jgi:hypothetical protein
MNYKFNEDVIIAHLQNYIDATYDQHYSMGKIQSTEFIFDADQGEGFCIGNIIKYAQRFGTKDGRNDKDLYKVLHYAIILLGSIQEERERAFIDDEAQGSRKWQA